jgi:hypothetical protein
MATVNFTTDRLQTYGDNVVVARWVRPLLSGGDGTTTLTVLLLARSG